MRKRNLGILYSHFFSRTEILVKSFHVSFPLKPVHGEFCQLLQLDGQEREIAKLQLYWGQFCHELVVRSAVGGYQTLTGDILPPATISNVAAIKVEANKLCRSGHFPWHIPTNCTELARKIGTSNYRQITAGLSLPAPVRELMAVRNYVEHPSKQTQIAYKRVARKYGLPAASPVRLLSTLQSSGNKLFDNWVISLRLMAKTAIR